jgi:hypothetical protein
MSSYRWVLALLLVLGLAVGCGSKSDTHGMMGKGISTDKLDVATFGKGAEAKYCPVSGDAIPTGKGWVHKFKDGKKITLCCTSCVSDVEKDPGKYKDFMY